MVLNFETGLANLRLLAYHALVLGIIQNIPLATNTLELTVILLLHFIEFFINQSV
jgi:hypothetical protein